MREIPFITIRCYGSGKENEKFLAILFEAQEKYPSLVNEIWFAGGNFNGLEFSRREAAETVIYRERCQKADIAFSFQQGNTLGHGADDRDYPGFPDDCWSVSIDGKVSKGIFCPLAPAALEYTYQTARLFMEILQPDSYWPDDDLRLCRKNGISCCCDRCMARFNSEYGCDLTREALKTALTGQADENALAIRRHWQSFNSRRLSEFAAVFRRAADEVKPECRLGLQAVSASWVGDGEDHREILYSLSGSGKYKVGIRPGALYFGDAFLRDMIRKALDMLKEAANCRKYGFVEQVTAEVENYPHVSAGKNPAGQMLEAAVMLAHGVDSLALYWGADVNGESDENYRFYFDLLAAHKPFFLAVRDTFAHTSPTGIALYRGKNKLAHEKWQEEGFETESNIVCNTLPVTRMAAKPACFMLDSRCAWELSAADLPDCFGKTVLLDIEAWQILSERFPEAPFIRQVEISPLAAVDMAGGAGRLSELFDDGSRAADVAGIIRSKSAKVIPLSKISGVNDSCGSCMIDSGFGGKIILIQKLANRWFWTGPRRKMILDALDKALPGKMPVRLFPGGFAVWVVAHVDEEGKTAGAFLVNLGSGVTMPLDIALRDPSACEFEALYSDGRAEKVNISLGGDEIICHLPPLQACQALLLRPCRI